MTRSETSCKPKRTSYLENIKSQFYMAAVCGCVYIGSQIEILGGNCQEMICIEGLDNKLTHCMIDLIVSSVSI